jgi:hypothetical protein
MNVVFCWQLRGIATALTREALRITRESGRRIVTLQASSEGEPVCANIGFETVARYRLFQFPSSDRTGAAYARRLAGKPQPGVLLRS